MGECTKKLRHPPRTRYLPWIVFSTASSLPRPLALRLFFPRLQPRTPNLQPFFLPITTSLIFHTPGRSGNCVSNSNRCEPPSTLAAASVHRGLTSSASLAAPASPPRLRSRPATKNPFTAPPAADSSLRLAASGPHANPSRLSQTASTFRAKLNYAFNCPCASIQTARSWYNRPRT